MDREDLWYMEDYPPTVYDVEQNHEADTVVKVKMRRKHQRFTRASDGAVTYLNPAHCECHTPGGGVPLNEVAARERRPLDRIEVSEKCPWTDDAEWETVQDLADPEDYADEEGMQPTLKAAMR